MNCRQFTAVVLVGCLMQVSLLEANTASHQTIKQQASLFGAGAKVKLKLTSGKKLEGSISAIEDDGFLLASQPGTSPARIEYAEVAQLKLRNLSYRASGQPDAAEARRVVAGLGVGKHVMVKVGEKKLRGHIGAIEEGHFTLLPDREAAPVQIAYNDVRQVGKNPSTGATIAIAAAAVAATVIIIFLVIRYHINE